MTGQNIELKVSGSKKAVEGFLGRLEGIFPLMVASNLMPNDRDGGCHCFVKLKEAWSE